MAELIQFNCPACSTLLRLPLAMASQQGPCPTCHQEIMAPDPHLGTGAQLVSLPSPPPVIEPFRPFVGLPSERVETQPIIALTPKPLPPPQRESPVPAPPQPTPQPTPRCASLQWAVLLLSSALALLAGFVIGYYWHQRSSPPPPLVSTPKVEEPISAAVKPTEPVPVRVKPFIEASIEGPKPEPTPEPSKVSAASEATLQAFLEAPDWAARSAYVLFPEKMRIAMEAYSRVVPDGPTPFKSISVQQSHLDEKTGNTLFVFFVKTEKFPDGIPVAVQETASGWLVDWQAFVEFRDGLFQKFVTGPTDQTARFHLMVSPLPPERAAKNENEHFASFSLRSPLDQTPQTGYVKKSSEIFATFRAATEGSTPFTPVLEITKRTTSEGKSYLEVVNLVSTDWLPSDE